MIVPCEGRRDGNELPATLPALLAALRKSALPRAC
jgi:hypothetical protein